MNLSTFGNLRCNFIVFLSECSHLLCTQGLTQHCCHLVCIWCTWHYVIATFNYCHLIYIWHVEFLRSQSSPSSVPCMWYNHPDLCQRVWKLLGLFQHRRPEIDTFEMIYSSSKVHCILSKCSFLQMFSSSFTSFAFIFISSRNSGNSIVPLPSTSTCHWWWCTSLVL